MRSVAAEAPSAPPAGYNVCCTTSHGQSKEICAAGCWPHVTPMLEVLDTRCSTAGRQLHVDAAVSKMTAMLCFLPTFLLLSSCRRNDNLQARVTAKADKKRAKREKKLLRPGFEGRRSGFIPSPGGGGGGGSGT